MSTDITKLLQDWPYDSDDNTRIVPAEDGRSVLQVRQPLGIEQYELDGRPDGARPFGCETVVDQVEERLLEHTETHGGPDDFKLSHDDCVMMQNEGILFYYRYLLLFQLNDFDRVIRDTAHNLRICSLLESYCDNEEDRDAVLQFKPYIYRMHAVATAMAEMKEHGYENARTIVKDAITEIEGMDEVEAPAFQFERVRSIKYLKSVLDQIKESEPDPMVRLSVELEQAVEDEDYERAAQLRDRIRELS